MPGLLHVSDGSRKRKHGKGDGVAEKVTARKAPKTSSEEDAQADTLLLEQQILESREHYNNIVTLQNLVLEVDHAPQNAILAAVGLCRVFCRLIASERLVKHSLLSVSEEQVATWLNSRLLEYVETLLAWIGDANATKESTALTLLMRLVKSQTSGTSDSAEKAWRSEYGTFCSIITALVQHEDAEGARQEFVEKYVEEHDDIRFYTFLAVKKVLLRESSAQTHGVGNVLDLLSQIEGVPETKEELEDWYGPEPRDKSPLLSLNAHLKSAREAWQEVFRSFLSPDHRKMVLGIMQTQVLPWFAGHLEMLADFLTDSFNQGGAVSLLSLSGIFHLMVKRNLDYPDFYAKLYSLLDSDILHSKHRSRFFRLFETFMNSTHLPAAMVASFMKRLSRLALQAPPGAIVWVVPWVYNTMKQHPSCTFMLHRAAHPAHAIYARHPQFEEEGMEDPFDMQERDPMHTGALDSSLWELDALHSHYHPNVATLAKIVGEQFTKKDYQLEDFLDHSYASLIDAELGKDIKKAPVVEWEIPKRIVTAEEGGLNRLGALLQSAVDAS